MSDGAFCHYCKRAASVCMCGVTVNPAPVVCQATAQPAQRPDREWLRKAGGAEDKCESVSVGGLAHDQGLGATPAPRPDLDKLEGMIQYDWAKAVEESQRWRAYIERMEAIALELNDTSNVPQIRGWLKEALEKLVEEICRGRGAAVADGAP